MTALLIIIFWLLPGIIAYVLVGWKTRHWFLTKEDFFLLIPVVNIVALCLVLCILFDEWLGRIRQ